MNEIPKRCGRKKLVPLFTLASLLLLATAAQADDSARLSAKVISVNGNARWFTNTVWTALRAGTELREGVSLQTGIEDSTTADIELAGPDPGGKCTIRIFRNSLV